MKLVLVGSGYVGQVNAVAAAHYGHTVHLVDIVPEKVESINKGTPTIFEKGLPEMLAKQVAEGRLTATLNLQQAVQNSEVSFICVGTPDQGGMIDLGFIREVAKGIGQALHDMDQFHVVVVKSTVIPGTTLQVVKPILEKYSGKQAGVEFGIAMNPEFLREGVALDDSLYPDSIVLGTEDDQSKKILQAVYNWAPPEKITYVSTTAAEAIKYAKNSFLAMKITFANEWANFCETKQIDIKEVMDAIGLDKRISGQFLRSGPGYGGSCFPKDVNAIIHAGQVNHSPFRILEQVVQVNSIQYLHLIDLATRTLQSLKMGPLAGKKIAILGLSFKPETDDTRESPALKLIAYLKSIGCEIHAYCPQGIKMAKQWVKDNHIQQISFEASAENCTSNIDCVFIPTPWKEFQPVVSKLTVPVFIGHRDFLISLKETQSTDKPTNLYALGYPNAKTF